MAFDPSDNPGRNKTDSAGSELKSITGASYYRPGEEGTADRTVSNAVNAQMRTLASEAAAVEGGPLEGWNFEAALERSLTNFAYMLKNGKDAASLLTEKINLGNA